MKNLLLLITLLLSLSVFSQKEFKKSNFFIRVYDLNNKKIGKGHFIYATDSTLVLNNSGDNLVFQIKDIGKLKTKRSTGNTILVPAAVGATIMATIGVATADPDALFGYTAAEGATGGLIIGALSGGFIGTISFITKNSNSYEINGDQEKWNAFINLVSLIQHNKQFNKQKGHQ